MLVLPGGGYSHYGEHEAEPMAQWLAGLGLHAFTLHYPVGTRHPGPLDAARSALTWIHDGDHGLEIDRSRVAVIGFSAGGHLAAHLVTTLAAEGSPLLPAWLVLGYPVVTFDADGHQGSAVNLLGPDASPELLAQHSPLEHLSAVHPPTFLWHTADDAVVPLAGTLRYTAGLAALGVPVDLHVFAHGIHGIGLARPGLDPSPTASTVTEDMDAAEWPALCERWFARAGWL